MEERLERVEIGLQRRLRIDHDLLAAGQANDHVGTQASAVGRDRTLFDEVAVVQHTGHLDRAAKLHFSPASAHVRRAQGLYQLGGFRLQLLLRAGERDDLLAQRAIGVHALRLQGLDLLFDRLERLLDRFHQSGDGQLARRQAAFSLLVKRLQAGLGQLQERLVIAGQRVGGKPVKGVLQLLRGLSQQLEFFGRAVAFLAQTLVEHRNFLLGTLFVSSENFQLGAGIAQFADAPRDLGLQSGEA